MKGRLNKIPHRDYRQEHPRRPDDEMMDAEMTEKITKAFGVLSYREEAILTLRLGLGYDHIHTLKEVGHIFKLTRERIRQIEQRAIMKLKSTVHQSGLWDQYFRK